MKISINNLLAILFLTLSLRAVQAEPTKTLSKQQPVTQVRWGDLPVSFADGYIEMVRAELSKSFSPDLVQSIISNSGPYVYPAAWKQYPKDQLKIYYVGSFNNTFGGRFRRVESVLWVPYSENKKLWENDYHLKPYDFFILISKEAVTL